MFCEECVEPFVDPGLYCKHQCDNHLYQCDHGGECLADNLGVISGTTEQCSHLFALFAVFDDFKKMNCSHCSSFALFAQCELFALFE